MDSTLLIALLGSSALATVIAGIFEIFRFRRERKAKKEDDADLKIEKRLNTIETQTAAQSEALKYIMYDRIRFLGQEYIAEGEIDFDDRRILNAMHSVYHSGLNGNGDLDNLMRDVNALKLKRKD